LAFFNLKNRASRKAVIHEYKIEEKSMAQTDPFLPLELLQTGQSAKSRFWELEGYKAAIGDLIQRPKPAVEDAGEIFPP
jgi:hypothetical protein